MGFKNFLICEFGEIENADVSNIQFFRSGNGVASEFTVDEEKYVVSFSPQALEVGGNILTKNGALIAFAGPRGLRLTHRGRPFKVYSEMLRVIKAYLERYQPEGLTFSGSTDGMDQVYARFINRFLKDQPGRVAEEVFVKVTGEIYIRKDVYESLPPRLKSMITKRLKADAADAKAVESQRQARPRANVNLLHKWAFHRPSNALYFLDDYDSSSGNYVAWVAKQGAYAAKKRFMTPEKANILGSYMISPEQVGGNQNLAQLAQQIKKSATEDLPSAFNSPQSRQAATDAKRAAAIAGYYRMDY